MTTYAGERVGNAHRIVSAILRTLEFCGSAIILGLLARFFYRLNQVDGPSNSRLVYALSLSAISVFFTLILVPPLKYTMYCFPIDFALFICWITCFALLEELTGTNTCTSSWFNSYWAVFWNGSTDVIISSGCSQWRVVLAFSFIVSFIWLTSGFLGWYACIAYYNLGGHTVSMARKLKFWKKTKKEDLENGASNGAGHPRPNPQPIESRLPRLDKQGTSRRKKKEGAVEGGRGRVCRFAGSQVRGQLADFSLDSVDITSVWG